MFQYEISGGVITSKKAITAYATGGQANATVLNDTYNRIDTAAADNDSVKTKAAILNEPMFIANSSGFDIEVFPEDNKNFFGKAVNESIILVDGNTLNLFPFEDSQYTIM